MSDLQHPWYQHYHSSVPHTINADAYQNIVEIFDQSCEKFGNQVAYENMCVAITYNDLKRLSYNFAAWIQQNTDLKPGDRIAIQMPNLLQYPVCLYGAFVAGLVVVNTNPLYTAREMEHQFNDSGAKAIVIVANFASTLQEILPRTGIKTVIITRIPDLFAQPKQFIVNVVLKHVKKMVPDYTIAGAIDFRDTVKARTAPKRYAAKNTETAFLQYTGGTTGVSKGAILTHRNVIANMLQIRAVMGPFMTERKEVLITPLPLYHIFSLTVNCLTFVTLGAKNVLITNPRDIPGFVKELSKQPFTILTGVNTLFNGLLNNDEFRKLNFSTLRYTVGGAMAIQKAVAERWKEVTGTTLLEGYGLTETSPVASVNPLQGNDRIGTIGVPVPSTDMKLLDDDGNEVPLGDPGEINVRGPQVMMGYYNKVEETENVLRDGWLRTGDVAIMTADGFFKIVDRKKDMIIVSGFNVYPNEVEDVVAMHPKVLEVAAVGVADAKSTEAVKIFVVKKDATLTEAELRQHCEKNLTGYKQPKHIEFRTELPKTNVGKILRRALRDEVKE